jgi:hypothetical protein
MGEVALQQPFVSLGYGYGSGCGNPTRSLLRPGVERGLDWKTICGPAPLEADFLVLAEQPTQCLAALGRLALRRPTAPKRGLPAGKPRETSERRRLEIVAKAPEASDTRTPKVEARRPPPRRLTRAEHATLGVVQVETTKVQLHEVERTPVGRLIVRAQPALSS